MPRNVKKQVDKIGPKQKGKKICKDKKNDENKSQEGRIECHQNIDDAQIGQDIKNNEEVAGGSHQPEQEDSVFNNGEIQENHIQNLEIHQDKKQYSSDSELQERIDNLKKQSQNEKESKGDGMWDENSDQNQSQNQEQYDQDQEQSINQQIREQNQLSGSSGPIIPALQTMQFRKVRGTRIQGLIEGKIKIDDGALTNQVNQYLGVKIKPKDQNADSQKKDKSKQVRQKKKQHKKSQDSEDQHSIYNYNEEDSSDQQDYIQSSSGRDQFDSDFNYTDSYPGKRGRKKGSCGRKRGRGRPKLNQDGTQRPHRKRGRPRKIRPEGQNDNQFGQKPPLTHNEDLRENPDKKRRGRPRKNQNSIYNSDVKVIKIGGQAGKSFVNPQNILNQMMKNKSFTPNFSYPIPQMFDQNYGLLMNMNAAMNTLNMRYPIHSYQIPQNSFNSNPNEDVDMFFVDGIQNRDQNNDIKQKEGNQDPIKNKEQ